MEGRRLPGDHVRGRAVPVRAGHPDDEDWSGVHRPAPPAGPVERAQHAGDRGDPGLPVAVREAGGSLRPGPVRGRRPDPPAGLHHALRESIGVGVLALLLTAVVYVPGMLLGYAVLKTGALDGVRLTSTHLQGAVDVVWKPIVDWMAGGLPDALLLPLGGVVILIAIKLLDRVLPEFDPSRRARGDGARWRTHWPLFTLGFAITLVTFSVSVALTVLVPMAAKGYITRREAIPYIMGANVATLADTLLVAVLYNNAVGVQIVLAEAIGVALVTLVCLVFLYRPLSRGALAIDDWVVSTNRRLALFAVSLFVFPALLVGAGFLIGPVTCPRIAERF